MAANGGDREAALAPRPRGSTAPEGVAGSNHSMWVYAGNGDGMPRRVERNLEMYAQRRQADTEMRRDLATQVRSSLKS